MGRDKFASMTAAASAAPRRDKFAAVQQQKLTDNLKLQRQALLDRCDQRAAVWKDLEAAEAAVTKLLDLSARTVDQLVEQTTKSIGNDVDTTEDLSQIQTVYRDTVADIHRLLSPHSDLVQAYKAPTHINRMYVQRVEHRLAESRLELMQELLLQEDEAEQISGPTKEESTGKRKRDN